MKTKFLCNSLLTIYSVVSATFFLCHIFVVGPFVCKMRKKKRKKIEKVTETLIRIYVYMLVSVRVLFKLVLRTLVHTYCVAVY